MSDLNDLPVRAIVEEQDTLDRGSEFMYEGARFVCHVRTESVPTVYRILGNFYTGLFAMGDAMEYLSHDLDRAIAAGNLRHDRPDGDPEAAVREAKKYLEASRYHAREFAAKLQAAQQLIAAVGHSDDA